MKLFQFSPETREILKRMPDAVAAFQHDDRRMEALTVSRSFLEMFGYTTTEEALDALNTDPFRGIHPEDIARVEDTVHRFIFGNGAFDTVFRYRSRLWKDDHLIHAVGRHITPSEAGIALVSCMDESASAEREEDRSGCLKETLEQRLEAVRFGRTHRFDDLTGLPNMADLLQNGSERVREMKEQGFSPVVLYLDYCHLKLFNNRHGFLTGDVLIRGLGGLLRTTFGMDFSARQESDHFVVLTDREGVEGKLKQLFAETRKLNFGNSLPLKVGIYDTAFGMTDFTQACRRAKQACDSLENTLISDYAWFDREIMEQASLREYIIRNFHRAMEEGWIQVYYQPVIRSLTGSFCGAEALVRWIDPVHGMILPNHFIPVLEEINQIFQMDLYVFEQVCRDFQSLRESRRSIVPVSVNLSRTDFCHSDAADRIECLAEKYEVPRDIINIEITESAFAENVSEIGRGIERFHQLGYQVWMDDFGTGSSSLGILKDYSFDELKIDMSFLSSDSEKARSIIRSTVRMAKQIGIQTLAEGVETEEQYRFLRSIGCEKLQGYYFGKPMPLPEMDEHFRKIRVTKEMPGWRRYYEKMSRIDLQTDEPLCIVEDDGITMKILFANKAYRRVLKRDHVSSVRDWEDQINTKNNPLHTLHRQFADQLLRARSGLQSVTYPSGDHYMLLTGSTVTRYESYCLYRMNLRYVEINRQADEQKKADFLQNLYYVCNDAAVIDYDEDVVYSLKSSLSEQPIGLNWKTRDIRTVFRTWTDRFVYIPDQKAYRAFMNVSTLRRRLRMIPEKILSGYFRSISDSGEYQWLHHMILPIPRTDFRKFLYVTFQAGPDEETRRSFVRDFYKKNNLPLSNVNPAQDISDAVLWRNWVMNSTDRIFWKDRNHRFLGASQGFLNFFGLRSARNIIGKTAEEMKWYVEERAMEEEEESLLRTGERIHNRLQRCTVRGRQHFVTIDMIPIYRSGKIAGLIGSLTEAGGMSPALAEEEDTDGEE